MTSFVLLMLMNNWCWVFFTTTTRTTSIGLSYGLRYVDVEESLMLGICSCNGTKILTVDLRLILCWCWWTKTNHQWFMNLNQRSIVSQPDTYHCSPCCHKKPVTKTNRQWFININQRSIVSQLTCHCSVSCHKNQSSIIHQH